MSKFNGFNFLTKIIPGNSVPRIEYLDGWRGLAIILVLLEHFSSIHLPKVGRLGVDIFFVLSGFLMSNILFEKKITLKKFYLRRFSRIIPVFFLFVLAVYLYGYFSNFSFTLVEFFSTLVFLRTYIPGDPNIWLTKIPVGHLWSINIEEHFYMIISMVSLVKISRCKVGLLLIFLGFSTIVTTICYIKFSHLSSENYALRTECASTCLFFSAGYFLLKPKVIQYVKPWMPVLSFFLALFCYTPHAPWYSSFMLAPAFLAFSINHLSEAGFLFQQAFSFLPLRLMGIWSYSIYLWQQPCYSLKAVLPAYFALMLAVILGLISFYFLENPARIFLNRRFSD